MPVSISGAGSISGLDQGFNVTTGSVGVGTTNPRTDLQVGAFGGGDSNIQLATGTSGASNILFGDSSAGSNYYKGFIKYNHSTDNLELYTTDDLIHYTGGSERLRINAAGNVGIASATPAARLDVYKDFGGIGAGTYAGRVYGTDTGVNETGVRFVTKGTGDLHNASDAYLMHGISNGTTRFVFGANGNVGINDTNPTAKLSVVGNAYVSADSFMGENAGIFFSGWNDYGAGVYGRNSGNDLVMNAGSSEKVRITSAGLVGVGTDVPSGKFNIFGSDSQLLNIVQNTGDLQIRLNDRGAGSAYIKVPDNTGGSLAFWTGGSERYRITSDGKFGVNVTSPGCQTGGIHAVHDATQGTPSFTGAEVGIFQRNYNGSQDCAVSIVSGTNASSTINFGDKDDVNPGIIEYMNGSNAMRFSTNAAERLRITSSGALNLSSPSSSVAAGLLNVPNGSRLSSNVTPRGTYATGNGGVVDMARYEMISMCITSFPANNNAICAINGAPLFIHDARTAWDRYYALPNYLLGTLTHDCINNTSFNITLACTMTVFMGRSSTWNSVPLTGWNLIESNTSIGPFSGNTRLYVKTLAAGTHSLDNDSAMYFFSL